MKIPLIMSVVALTGAVSYVAASSVPDVTETDIDALEAQFEQERSALTSREATLAREAAELTDRIAAIEAERAGLVDENTTLAQRLSDIESAEQEHSAALDAATAERDRLMQELEEVGAQLASLEADNLALTSETSELTDTLASVQAELEAAQSVSATQSETVAETTEGNDAGGSAIEALTAERDASQKEIETLQASLAEFDSERTTLTARIAELEASSADLDARSAELDARAAELDARSAELEARAAEQTELADAPEATAPVVNTDQAEEIALLNDLVELQLGELSAAQSRVDDLEATTAAFESEVATLTETMTERDALIAELQAAPPQLVDTTPLGSCQGRTDAILSETPIEFNNGTTAIADSTVPHLEELAAIALECIELELTLDIEGHTDSDGGEASNLLLSNGRADAVYNFFIEQGVPETSMRSIGFGEGDPIADNGTSEGRALNRRVVLDWD